MNVRAVIGKLYCGFTNVIACSGNRVVETGMFVFEEQMRAIMPFRRKDRVEEERTVSSF